MNVSAMLCSLLAACLMLPAAARTEGMAKPDIADQYGPAQLRDTYRFAVSRLKMLAGKRLAYTYDFVTDSSLALAGGNAIKSQTKMSYAYDDKGRSRFVSSMAGMERIVIADPTQHAVYLVCPERKEILRLQGAVLDEPAPEKAPSLPGGMGDLGEKTIAGVRAHGARSEQIIPAGAQGNEKPLVHKSETWFSPELAAIVSMRLSMPEIGDFYTHVENLKFGDVPASTFALPEGYAIRDIALHE